MNDQWRGIRKTAQAQLSQRDYELRSLSARLAGGGVEAAELLKADRNDPEVAAAWIPGLEVLPRAIYPQRHRGFFGEFVRKGEGRLAEIGFWPDQWATARMFSGTAKGFHIHPPFIPEEEEPERWFQRLFVTNPKDFQARPYAREQWDAMFFVQGIAEMLLVDERRGLERRKMRVIIEGDDHRGPNNAGLVIPAGVAHAVRVASSVDLIMVYGTSTKFDPLFEGRIASGVESAPLPEEWEKYRTG
jgi:dTDP-4-dehydrorhamnose 3,5-epimerase-like enzyme